MMLPEPTCTGCHTPSLHCHFFSFKMIFSKWIQSHLISLGLFNYHPGRITSVDCLDSWLCVNSPVSRRSCLPGISLQLLLEAGGVVQKVLCGARRGDEWGLSDSREKLPLSSCFCWGCEEATSALGMHFCWWESCCLTCIFQKRLC